MSAMPKKTKTIAEFGDFQTPATLAIAATELLTRLGVRPRSIVEPTCGRGSFIVAASACFPKTEIILGVDVNQDHLDAAASVTDSSRVTLLRGDFFTLDWRKVITNDGEPWLVIGNPPWVTSAALGAIKSENIPEKSNSRGLMGIEAITGKSNFDISEWMLHRYLEWFNGRSGTIAVLCKTAVARKVLLRIWEMHLPLYSARIYKIDAVKHFGAAVDACFFVVETSPESYSTSCSVYSSFDDKEPTSTLSFLDGHLISMLPHLIASGSCSGRMSITSGGPE